MRDAATVCTGSGFISGWMNYSQPVVKSLPVNHKTKQTEQLSIMSGPSVFINPSLCSSSTLLVLSKCQALFLGDSLSVPCTSEHGQMPVCCLIWSFWQKFRSQYQGEVLEEGSFSEGKVRRDSWLCPPTSETIMMEKKAVADRGSHYLNQPTNSVLQFLNFPNR